MTMWLSLEGGGATINLQAGGYKVLDGYYPAVELDSGKHVTERIDVWIIGASSADVSGKVQAITKILEFARRVATAQPAWLHFAMDYAGATYRSRIYAGQAMLDTGLGKRWGANKMKLSLTLERDSFWDADTPISIHLTNGNGTDQLTLNVYNCNDATGNSPNKKNNWAKIPAAELTGDLPAPAFLQFKDLVANNIDTMMIASNVNSDPANLVHWYEGETGSGDTAEASCSGGNYHAFSGTSFSVTKTITTQASLMEGGYYRVLARLRGTAEWKIKPFLALNSLKSYGPVQTVNLASYADFYLWDLGIVLHLPARDFSAGTPLDYGLVTMGFEAIKATSGTIDVDYLQLTPLDGWRRLSGQSFSTNTAFVLDEINNQVYTLYTPTPSVTSHGSARGGPILLYPGQEHRLYFLWMNSTVPEALPAVSGLLSMMYRPRRRML